VGKHFKWWKSSSLVIVTSLSHLLQLERVILDKSDAINDEGTNEVAHENDRRLQTESSHGRRQPIKHL
jgi:hypothetical protein